MLLEDLRTFFGCGWIRESRSDRTFKFVSRATSELVTHVVPHFEAYPLRGYKARSFQGFARVCRMIEQGDHLARSGLESIVRIAYEMNPSGTRRYEASAILRQLQGEEIVCASGNRG